VRDRCAHEASVRHDQDLKMYPSAFYAKRLVGKRKCIINIDVLLYFIILQTLNDMPILK
jgi:hypothetical protein